MNPDQIKLVQESFKKVVPIASEAAELFYGRLFTISPDLKPLFTGDIKVQGTKLMKMLSVVVSGLSNLDTLLPTVKALGKRHVDYGVTADMYGAVGESLLWTLEQGLSEAFTPDVKEAWTAAYLTLQTVMCDAAYSESI
ncbi:hemin receptor [Paraglaciecola hydrolytica]|uniref:Hemin receptor n=2 Tax=Paraglaciecola hydrolytica TaxID=1799789 RepID=A0A136A6W4_9ALTE|nr:hemin receptor [Paraglaciecola hydrolytica]